MHALGMHGVIGLDLRLAEAEGRGDVATVLDLVAVEEVGVASPVSISTGAGFHEVF
jgi:hypothetical protein